MNEPSNAGFLPSYFDVDTVLNSVKNNTIRFQCKSHLSCKVEDGNMIFLADAPFKGRVENILFPFAVKELSITVGIVENSRVTTKTVKFAGDNITKLIFRDPVYFSMAHSAVITFKLNTEQFINEKNPFDRHTGKIAKPVFTVLISKLEYEIVKIDISLLIPRIENGIVS